jgi:hypothetical protein
MISAYARTFTMHRSIVNATASALAVGILMHESSARCADPTTADCLAASEASLEAGNQHHLRAARNQLLVCSASSCPTDIRKECLHRVDEINASIPTVIFQAKDGRGNDLLAVKVTMDGEVIAERLEGTALSIDPGAHTFVFEAVGQPPLTTQLVIQEGQKDQHESVTIGPVAAPAAPPPSVGEPPGSASPASSSETGGTRLGPTKIAAIAAAGVGVVGIGVGTAFGLIAISKKNDADTVCPGQCATQAGVDKWNDAKSAAQISDIAFVVGGVGLAAGAILWFAIKSPSDDAGPHVGIGPGHLELRGTW